MTGESLKRLNELSAADIESAIRALTDHVKARLRVDSPLDRTKTGAHSEKTLGMNPVDYYVGEVISRFYSPTGWEWHFDRFDLATQLKRIANSIISKKIRDYKNRRDKLPATEYLEDLEFEVESNEEDTSDLEEISTALHEFVMEECNDDFELEYYASCFFESKSKDEIAAEMGLPKDKIEVLHRKLFRRAMKFRTIIEEESEV